METFTVTRLVHGGIVLETDIQIFKLLFFQWQTLNIFENPEKIMKKPASSL